MRIGKKLYIYIYSVLIYQFCTQLYLVINCFSKYINTVGTLARRISCFFAESNFRCGSALFFGRACVTLTATAPAFALFTFVAL